MLSFLPRVLRVVGLPVCARTGPLALLAARQLCLPDRPPGLAGPLLPRLLLRRLSGWEGPGLRAAAGGAVNQLQPGQQVGSRWAVLKAAGPHPAASRARPEARRGPAAGQRCRPGATARTLQVGTLPAKAPALVVASPSPLLRHNPVSGGQAPESPPHSLWGET